MRAVGRHLRILLIFLLFGFSAVYLVTPVSAADSVSSESSDDIPSFSPLENIARGTQIAGGVITLGFGIWHFFVPSIYGWKDYLEDDPSELGIAVGAVNFFFSASLSLVGAMNVVLPVFFPEVRISNTVWLWMNGALWTARFIYQVVRPQGTQIPGIAPAMLAGFAVTDLLFLFSAVVHTFFL